MLFNGIRPVGASLAKKALRTHVQAGIALQEHLVGSCRMFSSSSDGNDKNKKETKEKIANGMSKMKLMWKKYGTVFIGTYLGVYVTTLSSLFLALDYDVFNAAMVGLDPVAAVEKVHLTE